MAITIKEEQAEPGEKPWSHELDSIKHLTDVHMDFKRYLGKDFKLAKLDSDRLTQKQEFVMDMLPSALTAYELCPDKNVGKEIYEMIMAHINTLAIISFNQDNNMIVDRIAKWQRDERQEDTDSEESGKIKEYLARITGKKKPRQEE